MIKEALQYIVGLSPAQTLEIDKRMYSDKNLFPIKPPQPDPLAVSTLSSIVEYIHRDPDTLVDLAPYIIHVVDYDKVEVRLPFEKQFAGRTKVLVAESNANKFKFGQQIDRESFNIALQTQFVRNENASALLQLIGTMEENNGVSTKDDGFSQQVTAKTGVASLSNVVIPNPLELSPFRTFSEVPQPESLFVFRIHENMRCALYEADGERWKADCIRHIKEYFIFNFEGLIEQGKVVVLG